jgi:hypothetical protein
MANAKISQLPLASTPLAGTEVLPIVQSGVTDQVSVANLTFGRAVDTGNLTVTGTADVTGDFAVATTKFIVVASTGNTSVAGTFNSAGNFSVATNKFNVTATSGDTAIAGTLNAVGNFSVATNKFNVTASSGDTAVAGTLAVTGLSTVTGGLAGGIQALSGPGAVNLTTLTTNFTSTATGNALTLANGTAGQIKIVIYVAEAAAGDTGILTPTNRLGYSSVTLTAIGDCVTLQYTGTAWAVIAVRGATVNP